MSVYRYCTVIPATMACTPCVSADVCKVKLTMRKYTAEEWEALMKRPTPRLFPNESSKVEDNKGWVDPLLYPD